MLNTASPMEHLTAFAICWAFGLISFAVGQIAWQHTQVNWRLP